MAPEWQLPHWLPGLRAEEGSVNCEPADLCFPPVPCPASTRLGLRNIFASGEGARGAVAWAQALENGSMWSLQLLKVKTY